MLGKTKTKISAGVMAAVTIDVAVGVADGRDPHVAAHPTPTLARTIGRGLTSSYRFLTSTSATRLPKSLW